MFVVTMKFHLRVFGNNQYIFFLNNTVQLRIMVKKSSNFPQILRTSVQEVFVTGSHALPSFSVKERIPERPAT